MAREMVCVYVCVCVCVVLEVAGGSPTTDRVKATVTCGAFLRVLGIYGCPLPTYVRAPRGR